LLKGTTAKLADLGLARFVPSDNKMTTGVGTILWMAPEIMRGQEVYSVAADIFSMGVTLFELMANTLPQHPCLDPTEISPTVPFCNIIRWCIQISPSSRPTAKEVLVELNKALDV